jgi:hypothetical protein
LVSHHARVEHKEKLAATTRLEQFMRKYERECERSATLEKENAFLVDQVSGIKDETEVRSRRDMAYAPCLGSAHAEFQLLQKRLDLLKELEDAQRRNARQKDKLRECVACIFRCCWSRTDL